MIVASNDSGESYDDENEIVVIGAMVIVGRGGGCDNGVN